MKHPRIFRNPHWGGRFHSVFLLFLLLAFSTSALQAALVTKYVAWYADGFPSGLGLSAVQACTDLAAKLTAFPPGYPRTFHSIIASPSEAAYPCADDFLYMNYPACQMTRSPGPPSYIDSNCTDHAWVYSFVVDEPCTNHSIRLSGPGGTNGALADVEPGREVDGLRADVTCDGEPSSKQVTLTVNVEANTGGHSHHNNARPRGVLNPASGSSPLTFSFAAPALSGNHTITAQCTDGSCGTDTGFVWVGIHGLVNIPSSGFWNLIGDTTIHPAGHYLSGDAFGNLIDLARLYKQVYFPLNTPVLQLNDASLERGGLFDIDFVGRTAFWTPPHAEHRRGMVIDIQANGSATAIPQRNFPDFQDLLTSLGMTWFPHTLNQSGGHYHVRLQGVAQ